MPRPTFHVKDEENPRTYDDICREIGDVSMWNDAFGMDGVRCLTVIGGAVHASRDFSTVFVFGMAERLFFRIKVEKDEWWEVVFAPRPEDKKMVVPIRHEGHSY
jgi:hypothetical protein